MKVSPKKKKKKSNNMVVNNKTNLPENEKQKLVEHIKKILLKKTLYYNFKKLFLFRKHCFFPRAM